MLFWNIIFSFASSAAYENIALHKSAWQKHPYENQKLTADFDASKAVDGKRSDLSSRGKQCTISANEQSTATWHVNLGDILPIYNITIYYRTDNVDWDPENGYVYRFLGFSVYISNSTDKSDGDLCFKDKDFTNTTIPAIITLNCTQHGQYVIYYNERKPGDPLYYSKYAYNELCELEVYGCPSPKVFGIDCSEKCPSNCNGGRCHIMTGDCFGCIDGYQGPKCEQPCRSNTYGSQCSRTCGHCENGEQCNHINGSCFMGCEPGYHGTTCDEECPAGKYGKNCEKTCSVYCQQSAVCDRKTGECSGGCQDGWKLPICNRECDNRTFGSNCSRPCGHCLGYIQCNPRNGTCSSGCDLGFEGNDCVKECEYNFYGYNCNSSCSKSCRNQTCDSKSGKCLLRSLNKQDEAGMKMYSVIGGIIAILLLAVLVVVSFILCKRKQIRPQRKNQDTKAKGIHHDIMAGESTNEQFANLYCNTQEAKSDEIRSKKTSQSNNDSNEILQSNKQSAEGQEMDFDIDEKIHEENPYGDMYVNEKYSPDIPVQKLHAVIMEKGKKDNDGFKRDYAALPYGERYPWDNGKRPENIPKNRFKTTFPYDHSRVILRQFSGNTADYINANYIDGKERKNEYIASQGPKENTLTDFWEMICQEYATQIIMLTNLKEGRKIKCTQYWPNIHEVEIYGTVTVKLEEEKSYAFYTKRKLQVSQRGGKSYVVTQFHYTAWPDHGTPDPLCLVIFHNHVIREKVQQMSPTVVHCSAGIGRTGTYIALDALYNSGKASGKVNVPEYVKIMRANRMNMIQTYEQYMTVYLSLHEAFKASQKFENSGEFIERVASMLKDVPAKNASLKKEHELLKNVRPVYTSEDYKNAKENMPKYNKQMPLPLDKYSLYLTPNVPKRGNFINAIALSSYTAENAFIVTHYQQSEDVVDFLRLLSDYECSTVICMDTLHSVESSKAWLPLPSSEKSVPPYKVVCTSCQETNIKLSTLQLCKEGEKPQSVTIAEPRKAMNSTEASHDTSSFRNLVSFALNRSSKNPTVVVSRDGSSMCGVFCAVYNVIEQLTMDDNFDIFTTVRQLQRRRPELCSTLPEYNLIYQAVYDQMETSRENLYCNH